MEVAAAVGGGRVVLFDGYDFNGTSYPVNGNVSNLDGRFNDRAQSMIINSGTWELCNDANYGGGCQVYGPGRYANLGGLSRRVSSVRLTGGGRWRRLGRWRRRRQLGLGLRAPSCSKAPT